jgi:xanthine dehydrogenase accessory factor
VKRGSSKEVLDRVHAPIGIDINSETPEEIAVSIVAELIKVREESIS